MTVNKVPQPMSEVEIEEARAEVATWEQIGALIS